MNGNQDFIVTDGVPIKYTGPGGDATVPEGITEIGYAAFDGCTGLTGVFVPEGITEIGEWARRVGLLRLTIQEGATEIDEFAFYRCTDLTDPASSCAEQYARKANIPFKAI